MNNILLSSLGRVSTLLIWAQRVPIIVLPLGPRMRDWYSYRRYAMMCTCECFVLCIFALCMVVRWANTLFTLRVLWLSYSALWCLWNFVSILWNVFCYVSCFINKAKSWDMTILRFNMIVCICYLICKNLEHFCKPCKAWRKNFFYKITCNALIEVITCFWYTFNLQKLDIILFLINMSSKYLGAVCLRMVKTWHFGLLKFYSVFLWPAFVCWDKLVYIIPGDCGFCLNFLNYSVCKLWLVNVCNFKYCINAYKSMCCSCCYLVL